MSDPTKQKRVAVLAISWEGVGLDLELIVADLLKNNVCKGRAKNIVVRDVNYRTLTGKW